MGAFKHGRDVVAAVQCYLREINHAADKKTEQRLLRELRSYQQAQHTREEGNHVHG